MRSVRLLLERELAARWIPFTGTHSVPLEGFDPYKVLGVPRDASDSDIKRAYREKALSTHPDKHPELDRKLAQDQFTAVGNAYEILKDPEKRQQYDMTGSVGGGGGPRPMSQAEHERLVREFLRQHPELFQRPQQRPRPKPKPFPQEEMEAFVRADEASIHRASRASNIPTDNDARRARHAGKLGTIAKVDPSDGSVKVRLMVSPGRAEELWFGAGALWDPRTLAEGLEVKVCPDVDAIHRASRAARVGEENDARRARCAGKEGSVLRVDHADESVKVRVFVRPGRADELWFGFAAIEPLARQQQG